MNLLSLHKLAVWAMLVIAFLLAGLGIVPGSPRAEQVPQSVRDNPSAYKPVYKGASGWVPYVSSSGGYAYGK